MKDSIKACDLLSLPHECAAFDCQADSRTDWTITKVTTRDWRKSPVKVTVEYVQESKQSTSKSLSTAGLYVLNHISRMLHDEKLPLIELTNESMSMSRGRFTKTVTEGPFAGQTYWYPAKHVQITKQLDGSFMMTEWGDCGQNTISSGTQIGFPEPTQGANPLVSIGQREVSITNSGTRSYTLKNLLVKLNDLSAYTGLTEQQLNYAFRVERVLRPDDDNVYILNTAGDIDVVFDQFQFKPYYNGVLFSQHPNYKQLITGYGKTQPDSKMRWKLYADRTKYPNTDGAFGATLVVTFEGNATNNAINVVAGDTCSYDATTRTLTWDTSVQCMLIGEAEEYPAQGKNWTTWCAYNLNRGKITTTWVGDVDRPVQ